MRGGELPVTEAQGSEGGFTDAPWINMYYLFLLLFYLEMFFRCF